jgi:hypothetical protein
MLRKHPILLEAIIAIGAFFLFAPFLGGVHLFDWDEINFAESAREMILTRDFLTVQIDFQPFWEKPPLFIWMQVLSMKLFGINEFAARFPNVICGMLTLAVVFRTGRRIIDAEFAWIWVLAMIGSFLPFLYFKSGIIDPWFNLFIFAALLNLIFGLEEDRSGKRWKYLVFSAVLLGMANLTKGPVSVLLFVLTVGAYWALNRFRLKLSAGESLVFIAVLIFVGGLWFVIQAASGNFHIIRDFIEYQIRLLRTTDAGHGGFFLYHFLVLLVGVFPVSVFALKSFKTNYYDTSPQKRFKLWMITLFWVVLLVFTVVRTKIVHYSSLCYLPLTFLGAYVIYKIIHKRIKNTRWLNVFYAIMGGLIGLAFFSVPILAGRIDILISMGFFSDPFAEANIRTDVDWSGFESMIGIQLIAGIVVSLLLMKRNRKAAFVVMLLNVTIFTNLAIFFTVGKIEKYSQNALIEFCKERRGEDCYVLPLGMKSYAHLFYADKPIPVHERTSDQDWLCKGDIDKTAYLIIRSKSLDYYRGYYPELKILYEKSGFSFCYRESIITEAE